MNYLYNKDNRDSEFTQQFVRLCKLLPQMTNVKPTSSSSSSSMQTIGNKTDILNLLRFYKQTNKQWLQPKKSIELNTNLHVGLHDSLVHLIHNDDDNNDYADITSATTFNEAIFKASIEC
ncbi:RNA polymerase II associated protein 1 [Schistosoma haematobium]|uniref:RNA polymerase II associated protein 1 n=1 Tax=Schistosoma haematobium TaxID=6185 RepID=A0A922IFF7_SCHHA|nr:RNA polymerase II associated protein 1 [Schistosoma haematobium]KAH9578469.1 RNA polymerase II associated protein 1 [Schistosoma haematobium]